MTSDITDENGSENLVFDSHALVDSPENKRPSLPYNFFSWKIPRRIRRLESQRESFVVLPTVSKFEKISKGYS